MYTGIVIATLFTVLCMDHVASYLLGNSCDANPHVNGCSIPGDLPFFYKKVFNSDCNKHDICYACGEDVGITRSQCDHKFNDRMKHTCDTDSTVDNPTFCHVTAATYYAAVRLGGESHYHSPSESWCSESWVSACL